MRTLLMIFVLSSFVFAKTAEKTIAVVNNEPIMLSEFEKLAKPVIEGYKKTNLDFSPEDESRLKKRILDEMIDQKLLAQEAKRLKIAVTKRELQNGIEQVKERFRSEEEFLAELKNQGLTMKSFEEKIRQQLMVIRLIEMEVKSRAEHPTEKEAEELFKKIKSIDVKKDPATLRLENMSDEEKELEFLARLIKRESQEKVRARHILIMVDKNAPPKEKLNALSKINGIRRKIKDLKSFSEMARLHSEDLSTKDKGGDLGYFVRGEMVPEFENVAFSIEVGKVSEPVLTQFGYHLIFVEERKAGRELGFEDVKNDLLDYLTQKNATKRYEQYLSGLRKKASIKINPF